MRAAIASFVVYVAVSSLAGAIEDAIAHPERPGDDRDRDLTSKPALVLEFARVRPGMDVIDVYAAGGYYTEIVARAVGDQGRVVLHNNTGYMGFAGPAVEARLADGRLHNVDLLIEEVETLGLADDSFDLAIMVKTYHDLYWVRDAWKREPDAFFSTLRRILRPGGTLLVIDHVAVAGSGASAAQSLHRIDPEFAKRDIVAHGFVFDGALEVLRNPDDNSSLSVFDEKVAGKTDRFVYRFKSQ